MPNKKEPLKKTKKIIPGEKKEIFSLKSETKKSIVGVIFLAFSLFFFLSGFNLTGLVGQKINQFGRFLFGWGFWFFPLTLFFLSLVFFLSERIHHLYLTTILGGSFFFFSFLSLISLFSPGKGGFFGDLGAKLEGLFAFAGSLVFYLSFLIIGLLMALDVPLKLAKFFRKKKKEAEVISLDLEKEKEKGKKELSQEISRDRKEEEDEKEEIEKEILPEKEMPLAEEKKIGLNFSFSKKKKGKTEKIFPPLDIFTSKEEKPQSTDIKVSANIIRRTLASFGISVDLAEVDVGPTVTRYSFRPAEGTRLTRITALTNEIALSLAAHPIRIEAPIPGKSLIGIEVPNKVVSVVRLAPLLAKEEFKLSPPLVFPLGRDVTGLPFYADLSKMPHLLIAGSTGSGKSVCIHCLLSSLLFKNTPEELSLILIDPKKVELSLYEGLPHLISPVIVEAKKAISALNWLCSEMESRYELLLREKVRDLFAYNEKKRKQGETEEPYLVAVIDELADLMSNYPREIEASIVRLAQMARATGIHLVVSTQRPSTEVITGLIKANITSRIAFQVASQIDSRTILDAAGAEKLLGRGDMLFLSAELSKPKRIQAPFVSAKEIKKLVAFWQEEYKGQEEAPAGSLSEGLEESLTKEKISFDDFAPADDDELYQEAYQIIVQTGKASASLLQRKLRIGYARAARLLDLLEERGVVGPARGAKPREVLVSKEENSSTDDFNNF